jgi:hypothetical protein
MKNKVTLHSKDYTVIKPMDMTIWDFVTIIKADDGSVLGYKVNESIAYYSERYDRWIGAEKGDRSDGATYAKDLDSFGWIFHDELCNGGTFELGAKCSNWQASHVLTDIMKEEGYWFRTRSWFWGTWLAGGGEARDNGMF